MKITATYVKKIYFYFYGIYKKSDTKTNKIKMNYEFDIMLTTYIQDPEHNNIYVKILTVDYTIEEIELEFINNSLHTKIHIDSYFHLAMQIFDLKLAQLCLDYGADIYSYNNAAMWSAIESNFERGVKFLLNNGFDVNTDNDNGICLAVEYMNFQIVEYLIKNGADVFCRNNYPIMKLVEAGSLSLLKLAIEYSKYGILYNYIPITEYICSRNELALLKYYEDCGIDLHFNCDFLYCTAINYNAVDIIMYLNNQGAYLHDSIDADIKLEMKLRLINML